MDPLNFNVFYVPNQSTNLFSIKVNTCIFHNLKFISLLTSTLTLLNCLKIYIFTLNKCKITMCTSQDMINWSSKYPMIRVSNQKKKKKQSFWISLCFFILFGLILLGLGPVVLILQLMMIITFNLQLVEYIWMDTAMANEHSNGYSLHPHHSPLNFTRNILLPLTFLCLVSYGVFNLENYNFKFFWVWCTKLQVWSLILSLFAASLKIKKLVHCTEILWFFFYCRE